MTLTKSAAVVFAPTKADGTARGADMVDTQVWGNEVEGAIGTLYMSSTAKYVRGYYSELPSISGAQDGEIANVILDAPNYNGVYRRISGSWVKQSDLSTDIANAAAQVAAAAQTAATNANAAISALVNSVQPIVAAAAFSGTFAGSSATITLPVSGATPDKVLLAVGNVIQSPSNYTISGTTLTLNYTPAANTGYAGFVINVSSVPTLLASLPGISTNVQGVGMPGLEGGKWFIRQAPSGFDSSPALRVDREINAASGTPAGYTYSSGWFRTDAGANVTSFEWNLKADLTNMSTAASRVENQSFCGTTFIPSGLSYEVSPSWGGTIVLNDQSGRANPTVNRWGAEIDHWLAPGAGTDNNRQRCIAYIGGGGPPSGGTTSHIGDGVIISSYTASIIDRGISFGGLHRGAGSYGIGIDFTDATFSGPVIALNENQKIAVDGHYDGSYSRTFRYQSGIIRYNTAQGDVWTLDDYGNIICNTSQPKYLNAYNTSIVGGTASGTPAIAQASAGALGTAAGNDINVAGVTINAGNTVSFNTHMRRISAGSDWTGVGASLSLDVDGIVASGGKIVLYNGNVGIGTDPTSGDKLVVGGSISASGPVKPASYTVSTLPSAGSAGRVAYCSNARMFNGTGTLEGSGSGSGGLVVDNGTAWKIAGTNVTVSA